MKIYLIYLYKFCKILFRQQLAEAQEIPSHKHLRHWMKHRPLIHRQILLSGMVIKNVHS